MMAQPATHQPEQTAAQQRRAAFLRALPATARKSNWSPQSVRVDLPARRPLRVRFNPARTR